MLYFLFRLLLPISILFCNSCETSSLLDINRKKVEQSTKEIPKVDVKKLQNKAQEALEYCKKNKFNDSICILIDMSLHSGVKRFFVWNFTKDTTVNSFLVGHGCGKKPWSDDLSKDKPVFSNVDGSHCSSLGKYKIGERGYSEWGIHIKYLLQGLETTNNNALKRAIVFHSWEVVSDEEVYPDGTPEGWGCPTISNNSFRIIDVTLKNLKSPVLMWIYQ